MVCIKSFYGVTEGKKYIALLDSYEYESFGISHSSVTFMSDDEYKSTLGTHWFISLCEYRKNKIAAIL